MARTLRIDVSGTALAAGFSQLFQEQKPVASAIPLTKSTPFELAPVGMESQFLAIARGFRAGVPTWLRRNHQTAPAAGR